MLWISSETALLIFFCLIARKVICEFLQLSFGKDLPIESQKQNLRKLLGRSNSVKRDVLGNMYLCLFAALLKLLQDELAMNLIFVIIKIYIY